MLDVHFFLGRFFEILIIPVKFFRIPVGILELFIFMIFSSTFLEFLSRGILWSFFGFQMSFFGFSLALLRFASEFLGQFPFLLGDRNFRNFDFPFFWESSGNFLKFFLSWNFSRDLGRNSSSSCLGSEIAV